MSGINNVEYNTFWNEEGKLTYEITSEKEEKSTNL